MTPSPSSPSSRVRDEIAALRTRPHAEVLIIGGGINGLATFRHLALQGVDVALVERSDFASGASAASSHMIHGGVRYLENGEFRLVIEAVRERMRLLRAAPHYVRPLRTTIPIFTTFSGIVSAPFRLLSHRPGKPKERGALLIKVGLVLYDSFSRGSVAAPSSRVPRHEFRGRKASLAAMPALNPGIKYTATYTDASLHDPERLALDVLADGLATGAGRAANYLAAVGAHEGGVLLRDALDGGEFAFQAPIVVNASGPWTDLTNSALGRPTSYLGGTKGSHIVLDHPELLAACADRELFFENKDGRIVLVYPLKGRVLVGTTDLEVENPDAPAVCTDEEVDYFIRLLAHVVPGIEISREHIVYRYAGIRPLPRHGDLAPGFVSRDYQVESGDLPGAPGVVVLSLIGGKWTTFRALGERLGRRVLGLLGRTEVVNTASLPIGGGRDFPETPELRDRWVDSRVRPGLGRDRVVALLERYGTRAAPLIEHLAVVGDIPLEHAPDYSRAEISRLVADEHVVHLMDLVQRRTSLAFLGAVHPGTLDELAEVAAEQLGWDAARRRDEVTRTRDSLSAIHGVALPRNRVEPSGREPAR